MSTYYPIEFLPETSTTELNLKNAIFEKTINPEPQNRNYLRNNLPYQESNTTDVQNTHEKIDYGKTSLNVTSSLIGGELPFALNTNKSNTNKLPKKIKERKTRINIDSRLRNIEPKHILDSTLHNLENPLFFTLNTNKIVVYHPNHNFLVEDKIILEYSTNINIKIKKGIQFQKNSNFAKIIHPDHQMLDLGTIYFINISNVEGNASSGTYLLNYPINLLNKNHKVYFKRSDTDIFDPNAYYINLEIPADAEYTYQYSFNLEFLHIRGIPLNEINSNYPITSDRIFGYHVIENVINSNFYEFSVSSLSDSTNMIYQDSFYKSTPIGNGGNILVIKILNTIEGYPDNNNYIIDLQRNFYHVKQINLLDTVFPITEKIVSAGPVGKQNNLFYWQNLNDGNIIYNIEIPSGNYSLSQLQTQLKTQIEQTIRPTIDSTQLINTIYTYNTNKVIINIDQVKNTFEIQFYQELILTNAIFRSTLSYPDGFTRIILNYINHNLLVNDTIILSNVIGTDKIPDTYLNGQFAIESVIDANTVSIRLNRFNDDTSGNTNGGTAIHMLQPIKSRLLFNQENTVGAILGFNKVGDIYSVTPYDYKLTNYNLYDVDVQKNSVGLTTLPRVDTRILNLYPYNYILILTDLPFNDQINLFNTSTNVLGKLLLVGTAENYVYSQFIQIGSTFQEPLATLSSISFSFYSPDNKLYDFNNVEHSFTIEIIEQLDELPIEGNQTG
jgi:hypothetical protein